MNLLSLKNAKPADALMTMGALLLLILSIGAVIMLIYQVSKPMNGYEGRTITVSATGDSYQVPDVAEFTYTVRKEGKDVAIVQEQATKQSNEVLAKLKALGIDEKDIQTQSITAQPKYEWQNKAVICAAGNYCPPEGKNVLVGYESASTVSVTLRDLELAGKVLQLLGESNVDNISGPNFTTEDPDAVLNEARNEALAKARVKAKGMAAAMGVRLGKVVSFSEGNDGYYPMMARTEAVMDMAAGPTMVKSAPAPTIVAGQDKVTVTVNVVYRIR